MPAVIVATKTSVWELHGSWYESQFKLGLINQSDFAKIKAAHDEHHESVRRVTEAFSKAKISFAVVNVDNKDWSVADDVRVLVTLGGDGTLLSASHRIGNQNVTLFGLRSSGTSVGFLCAGGVEKINDLVSSIQSNSFTVLSASRFHGEVYRAGSETPILTPPALNDFLYSNANPAGMTRYRFKLGDREEDHKSSGMWLSTALGSTAGVLAAGGVIQPRTDANFQYIVRELYRLPGKNFYLVNGFFDPDKKPFLIENRCEEAILAADGNHSVTRLAWGDRVVFRRSTPVKIAFS